MVGDLGVARRAKLKCGTAIWTPSQRADAGGSRPRLPRYCANALLSIPQDDPAPSDDKPTVRKH
jgi:hypothetical protein